MRSEVVARIGQLTCRSGPAPAPSDLRDDEAVDTLSLILRPTAAGGRNVASRLAFRGNRSVSAVLAVDYAAVIPAPFGALGLRIKSRCLASVDLLPAGAPLRPPRSDLARRTAEQFAVYFRDAKVSFDLPIVLTGTPFRLRVWSALRAIPCGETCTYGELAAKLGSSPRAVGQAVGDNPLPIIIPCHRVVGAHGLGGYAHADHGYLLDIKRWLLRHESTLGR